MKYRAQVVRMANSPREDYVTLTVRVGEDSCGTLSLEIPIAEAKTLRFGQKVTVALLWNEEP